MKGSKEVGGGVTPPVYKHNAHMIALKHVLRGLNEAGGVGGAQLPQHSAHMMGVSKFLGL